MAPPLNTPLGLQYRTTTGWFACPIFIRVCLFEISCCHATKRLYVTVYKLSALHHCGTSSCWHFTDNTTAVKVLEVSFMTIHWTDRNRFSQKFHSMDVARMFDIYRIVQRFPKRFSRSLFPNGSAIVDSDDECFPLPLGTAEMTSRLDHS